MKLTFEEAAAGVNTKIRIPRLEFCESCNGVGAKAGTGIQTCITCGGRGQVHYQQRFFHDIADVSGLPWRRTDCARGLSRLPRAGASGANASGGPADSARRGYRYPPALSRRGRARRQRGPGRRSLCGPEVKSHPYFERRDADLYCTVPVTIVQAALGAQISVPGLSGEETVKIPEGSQTGEIIRLKGKGLPDPHGGGKGDLYVNLHVATPTKLTREQRRLLLEQLGSTLPVENRPAQRDSSLFDKVKDIFG